MARRRRAFHDPFGPLALVASLSGPAYAQSVLPVVTVTVNKQAQTLESVPASVAVHDGDALEAAGITSLEAMADITPGLSFQPFGQAGIHSAVMRGLSAHFFSFSSSTLLLVDGVPTLMAQGFDDPLLAIDRVEVLRGPQSTLYGRNAEAGVISIHTKMPGKLPRGMVSAEVGSRNKQALRFDVSRPLVADTLYASVSGEGFSQNGFIDQLQAGGKEDDREHRNAKLALRWTPGPRTDAVLRYSQQNYRDGGSLWGAPAAPRHSVRSGSPSWNRSSGSTLSIDVAHEFRPGLRLRSITAQNDFLDRVQQDTDFTPPDTFHIGRDHHFRTLSQELRLEGQWGQASWLMGLYLDRDEHHLLNEQKSPMGLNKSAATLSGHAEALFTHWTVPLSERWAIAAGARLGHSELSFAPAETAAGAVQRASASQLTPKLALQYQMTPEHQLYVSVADGWRSGGFNVFVPAKNYAAYEPEQVRSFEIGSKGSLLQRRLRYSAALYLMKVRDMQVQQMPAPGVVYVTNAASARSTGAELELEHLLGAGWQVQAGLALNRTRFQTFRDGPNVYDGHRNPFAPDASGHLGARYDAPQGWYLQARLIAAGKVALDAANRYSRNGYGLLNLSAGCTVGSFEWSGYVSNLANKHYDAVGYQNGVVTVYSPPREVGARLTWRL